MRNIFAIPMVGIFVVILVNGASFADEKQVDGLPAVTQFEAVLLKDYDTGRILYEYNSDKIWPQASLTKMMLALVVFDAIEKGEISLGLRDVVVSRRASRTRGRTIGLQTGDRHSLEELLRAVMVTSANDAAVAVAEAACGSVEICVRRMNAKAKELDMDHTRYRTVNGMPTRSDRAPDKSSAKDIGILAGALLRQPALLAWTSQKAVAFGDRNRLLPNTNRLVGRMLGVDGLKTGYTQRARFNLATTARRGSLRLVAVILGAKTSKTRFRGARSLLEWGFKKFTRLPLFDRGSLLWADVRVENGSRSTLKPMAASGYAPLLLRSELESISVSLKLPGSVSAPVMREQVLGEIVIRKGNQTLSIIPAVSPEFVPRARWVHAWR